MRSKAASKTGSRSMNDKIAEMKSDQEFHENPFLKLLKTSKKEKQQTKSQNFNERIQKSVNLSGGVSKSTLRRHKRRAREQLKPKMDDLLLSLPDTGMEWPSSATTTVKPYIKSSKANVHQPNANNSKGHKVIMAQEHKNFSNVLKNPEFRSSPFSALKSAIAHNLEQR